jgi:transitional endoplasmic reticulum ATPase
MRAHNKEPGMFRRKSVHHLSGIRPAPAIVQLWALRILVHLIPAQKMAKNISQDFPELLAQGLNLIAADSEAKNPGGIPSLRKQMEQNLEDLEAELAIGELDSDYCAGLEPLVKALGLNDTEAAVLQFASAATLELVLQDAMGLLQSLDKRYAVHLLSVSLGLDAASVKAALGRQGVLARSGILALSSRESFDSARMFELLNDELPLLLVEAETQLEDVLRTVLQTTAEPDLTLQDYPHLQPLLGHATRYLTHSMRSRTQGVNVLLYGPPGTGKTELTKVVAQALGCTLYEVSHCDADGDPATTSERIRALMLAQLCLTQGPNLLLFDEVEEVFQGPATFLERERTAKYKAWLNRQLETNQVPTFWVANSVAHLDPAFARRFDLVMEIPVPPRNLREKIILSQTGQSLNAPTLRVLSEHTQLSPAVVTRAARVALAPARTKAAKAAAHTMLLDLVNQTLKVQGLPLVESPSDNDLFNQYRLQHLNPDVPLDGLVSRLTQHPRGRFCLYGPPGTGKSAFVRWVAQQLNKPLLLRRASDLLSQWVGGNEKNLAQAFEQAKRDDAVLLIDEVDTFLQPRENAVRGWEVSMVNEMLTQMESFNGLLFATTNLMQGMDAAAMRRFDVKVHLRAPTAEQLRNLLGKVTEELKLDAPTLANCQPLAKLGITPGDVAAVVRRQALVPISSLDELLLAIEGEGGFKPGGFKSEVQHPGFQ